MDNQPQLKFRNTRSKFYKQRAEESPDHPSKPQGDTHMSNHWKEKGNQAFRNGDFAQAIAHYTKAIDISAGQSVYFSNRARCHFLLGNYETALKDAQESIELDDKSIKGQMICGCSLAELAKKDHRKIELAIKRLNKEHFEEQVELAIYRAKKLQWYLRQEEESAELNTIVEQLRKTSEAKAKKLKQLFDSKRPRMEIPDHLCCKITLQLMEDPVVSSAGITYEREALLDHYKHNGFKDPFTNQTVSKQVCPNLAIKTAIRGFLEQNPWAFEYSKGENYMHLKF